MLTRVCFAWASETNRGEWHERQTHAHTWMDNKHTVVASGFVFFAHILPSHTLAQNWSNWGVVKEGASLISFCLPHCPAAFGRNSLQHFLSHIALCPPAAHPSDLPLDCLNGASGELRRWHEYKSNVNYFAKSSSKSAFHMTRTWLCAAVKNKSTCFQFIGCKKKNVLGSS